MIPKNFRFPLVVLWFLLFCSFLFAAFVVCISDPSETGLSASEAEGTAAPWFLWAPVVASIALVSWIATTKRWNNFLDWFGAPTLSHNLIAEDEAHGRTSAD